MWRLVLQAEDGPDTNYCPESTLYPQLQWRSCLTQKRCRVLPPATLLVLSRQCKLPSFISGRHMQKSWDLQPFSREEGSLNGLVHLRGYFSWAQTFAHPLSCPRPCYQMPAILIQGHLNMPICITVPCIYIAAWNLALACGSTLCMAGSYGYSNACNTRQTP